MPAILKGAGQIVRARKALPHIPTYVPRWPSAKGRPYSGRVPYFGIKTFVGMHAAYAMAGFKVTLHQADTQPVSPTFNRIVFVVCDVFGITRAELLSKSRRRYLAHPRQAVCALMREFTTESFPTIGRRLDRDHTTTLYAIEKVKRRLEVDAEFRSLFESARQAIGGGQ